jgi:YVTN family beta-propeller protein
MSVPELPNHPVSGREGRRSFWPIAIDGAVIALLLILASCPFPLSIHVRVVYPSSPVRTTEITDGSPFPGLGSMDGRASLAVTAEPLVGDAQASQDFHHASDFHSRGTLNESSIQVGLGPSFALYAGGSGLVYISNSGGDTVSVISGTDLYATVIVGSSPGDSCYNSREGYVYLPNGASDNVSVLNETRVVGSISVGDVPWGAACDNASGYVYVVNRNSANVSVLYGTSLRASVNVGSYPQSAIYDPQNGLVYVTNTYSDNVSIINDTGVVDSVAVGGDPVQATFDPANGFVYVANLASYNISILNGTTVIKSVRVSGAPDSLTYDPVDDLIYVAIQDAESVTLIRGLQVIGTTGVGDSPSSVVYDSGDGHVYISNYYSRNISDLMGNRTVGAIPTGANPETACYNPLNGYLYVPNAGSSNVSLIFTWPSVKFTQQGLPLGNEWWVNVTGGPLSLSSNNTLTLYRPDGTYTYRVSSENHSYEPLTPAGSIRINGTGLTEEVAFLEVTYAVTICESNLVTGTSWSVSIAGILRSSVSTSIAFEEPNGTYPYVLEPVPGWRTFAYDGEIAVNGSPALRTVVWSQVMYLVTFLESGLGGSDWSVNVTGGNGTSSSSASLAIDEPNGSYTYVVSAVNRTYHAPGGSFSVNGAPDYESVVFAEVTYTVQFDERGLPSGTGWTVALQGVPHFSETAAVTLVAPNGSYQFFVAAPSGYVPSPTEGMITVAGGNDTITIAFVSSVAATYTVTFSEAGLPSGTIWSVTFNGNIKNGTGDLAFPGIMNGTYSFTVGSLVNPEFGGYLPTPGTGALSVQGQPTYESIVFTPASSGPHPPPGPTFLGLPVLDAVLGGATIAALGVAAVVVMMRRRGGKPSLEPAEELPPSP